MVHLKYYTIVFILHSVLASEIPLKNLKTRRTFNLNHTKGLFEDFLKNYNKTYEEEEYNKRLEVFKNNLEHINELNRGNGTDVYGITEFSDMTYEEFHDKYAGMDGTNLGNDSHAFDLKIIARSIPDEWDWRTSGVVTEIHNQDACRSCWAFSAVGCVEGQHAIKHKRKVTLSAQQIIDCMKPGEGCRQYITFPHLAMNFAAGQGGFMADENYRYLGYQTPCRFDKNSTVAHLTGGKFYRLYNEEQLRTLVYSYGPVAIGFFIGKGFPKYKSGIATPESFGCDKPGVLNHSVLVIGFGVSNGVPYWIMKNSHGVNWGDQGFFTIERGRNACNILNYVATAHVL